MRIILQALMRRPRVQNPSQSLVEIA